MSYMPPATPQPTSGPSPWLFTAHLILDSYHARFSQDLYMGHVTPQQAGATGKGTSSGLCEVVFPLHPCTTSKVPADGYVWHTYYWTYTMPGQSGPAHGSWPSPGNFEHREVPMLCMVLYLSLSPVVLNRTSSKIHDS